MKIVSEYYKKIPPKMRKYGILMFILILVFAELVFDWGEILFGQFAAATNSFRQEKGRLWSMEKNDRSGSASVQEIEQNIIPGPQVDYQPRDLADLLQILNTNSDITLTREDFLAFYRRLSNDEAREIVEPLTLSKMMRNGQWKRSRIVGGQKNLSVYFIDDSGELIMDSHPSRYVLDVAESIRQPGQRLESYKDFSGRIVTAPTFYDAFDKLSKILQLQIINNPYNLIRWGNDLLRVGISRFSDNAVVEIGFEVNIGGQTRIFMYQASEIAAGYLIQEINKLQPSSKLALPGVRPHE